MTLPPRPQRKARHAGQFLLLTESHRLQQIRPGTAHRSASAGDISPPHTSRPCQAASNRLFGRGSDQFQRTCPPQRTRRRTVRGSHRQPCVGGRQTGLRFVDEPLHGAGADPGAPTHQHARDSVRRSYERHLHRQARRLTSPDPPPRWRSSHIRTAGSLRNPLDRLSNGCSPARPTDRSARIRPCTHQQADHYL